MDVLRDSLEESLLTVEQQVRVSALEAKGVHRPIALHMVLASRLEPTPSASAFHMFSYERVSFSSYRLGSFELLVISGRHSSARVVSFRFERQLWTADCSVRLVAFAPKSPLLGPICQYLRNNLQSGDVSLESFDIADALSGILRRWIPLDILHQRPRADIETFSLPLPDPQLEFPRGVWSGSTEGRVPYGYLPRDQQLTVVVTFPHRIRQQVFCCRAASRCGLLEYSIEVDHARPTIDSSFQTLMHHYVRDYGMLPPLGLYTRRNEELEDESVSLCDIGVFGFSQSVMTT